MASGHVNRAKRPNTWQHRPKPAYVKKALANPEPSTHGTKQTCPGDRMMSAVKGRADIGTASAQVGLPTRFGHSFCFRNRQSPCSRTADLNWMVPEHGRLVSRTVDRRIFVATRSNIITAGENWVTAVAIGLLQVMQAHVMVAVAWGSQRGARA
jgi:hypothetical protein